MIQNDIGFCSGSACRSMLRFMFWLLLFNSHALTSCTLLLNFFRPNIRWPKYFAGEQKYRTRRTGIGNNGNGLVLAPTPPFAIETHFDRAVLAWWNWVPWPVLGYRTPT